MDTLDEVIKVMDHVEFCCTNCKLQFDCDEVECFLEDALQYLKEYRSEKAMWEADRKGYLNWIEQYKEAREKHQQAVIELKKNPALTWDELKDMEGKPVWIEAESLSVGVSPYWKDWNIIKSFTNDEFMYCNDGYEWAKETQGRMWQAYRKERE